jgi:hypothetical protein
MKKTLVIFLVCVAGIVYGQDPTVKDLQSTTNKALTDDTTHKVGWKFGGLINLGLAQGSLSNWAAGGEDYSLTLNSYLNLYANLKRGKHKWINSLDLFYAIVNTESQGLRKNDDRIDFYSKYTYQFRPKLGAGVVGNFRSQFADGYDYNESPKKRISDWFAPAYFTLAPGLDWTPTPYLSVFISPISGRWTVVANHPFELAPLYGVDPNQKVKIEAGAFLSALFNKEVIKNVLVKSRLDLYSNYLKKPENIDIFWTNIIGMKINKYLTVTYNFDLIYDDDIRIFGPNGDAPRTQIKSLLSIAFSARL